MIHYKCPRCSERLEFPPSLAGRASKCPHCGKTHLVPRESGMSLLLSIVSVGLIKRIPTESKAKTVAIVLCLAPFIGLIGGSVAALGRELGTYGIAAWVFGGGLVASAGVSLVIVVVGVFVPGRRVPALAAQVLITVSFVVFWLAAIGLFLLGVWARSS